MPARVTLERKRLLGDLASRIVAVERPHPTRVGIDGVDAAGKTTLADELAVEIRAHGRTVIRSSIDRFHNPATVRHARGSDSGEGYYRDSFDYAALLTVLLDPLGPGGALRYREAVFDYRSESRVAEPERTAAPNAILLFDGVFLQRPELAERWDFSVFVEAGFDVTGTRRAARPRAIRQPGCSSQPIPPPLRARSAALSRRMRSPGPRLAGRAQRRSGAPGHRASLQRIR